MTLPAGWLTWLKWGAVAAAIAASAVITGSLVNSHWREKELLRDAEELKAQVKNAQENAAINKKWAQDFADLGAKFLADQQRNQATYEKTMADYRAGTIRLRQQFACYRDVSAAAAAGQPTDAARNCGLSDADVEFLIRTSREANRLRDKVTALQGAINAIYAGQEEKNKTK